MKSAANLRAKKIEGLMKRYNELIDQLPDGPRLQKLQKDDFKVLGLGDKLWEIDLLRSEQRWAFKPSIRRGIDAMNLVDRALEEVQITAEEAKRFLIWIDDKLS
jgi:hypothetical protein